MPTDDDSLQRLAALEKKVARLEQELTEARLSAQRASVQRALIDERLLTLERNRLFRLWNKLYRAAAGLYSRVGTGHRYGGLSDLRTPGDYQRFVSREQHDLAAEDHQGSVARWRSQPLISVLLKDGPGSADSLRSVFAQCYPHWELCLSPQLKSTLQAEIERGPSTARIVETPTAEYRLVLHAGDRLSPHALYFYAQALQDDSPAMVYADEDCIDNDGHRSQPMFKPGWSPELLHSTMYLGRAVLYRGDHMHRPWDFARQCDQQNLPVHHVPGVLYHRTASTPLESTTPTYTPPPGARLAIIICSRQARQLRECLQAIRKTASIPTDLLVVHHLDTGTGDDLRQCVEQFGGTWIPYRGTFDFALMNNLAAAKATAPFLLFLNDDVIVQQPGWDTALAATLARAEIGIAGAILQYPTRAIQHAGVVTGMGDAAGHCGRFQMSSDLWPWLRMTRDVTAVTGALLGIRWDLFQQLGGFDEAFPVNYNDVDLCLRVRQSGLRVVCLNLGEVVHRESQTRIGGTRHDEREALYRRWHQVLARTDEFYSPHLAANERIALSSEVPGRNPLKDLV